MTSDPDIERQVLGILLKHAPARDQAFENLGELYFGSEQHRAIYRACRDQYRERGKFNVVTVAAALKASGEFDSIGGAQPDLAAIYADAPDPGYVAEYCEYLRGWAERRTLQEILRMATADAHNLHESPRDVIERIEAAVHTIIQNDTGRDQVTERSDVLRDVIHRAATPDTRRVLPTGFQKLDSRIGGLRAGEVTFVGGRPGSGKSGFGLSLAHNIGVEQNTPIVYLSYEMSQDQIWHRELGWLARINHRLFDGRTQLSEQQIHALHDARERIERSGLYIEAVPGPTLPQLKSRLRRLQDSHGIRAAVIDQTNFLQTERAARRIDELSTLTRGIKRIAQELSMPLVALHQLNRESEKRADGRPTMSDFKDSGSFEEDADCVLLCHRPETLVTPPGIPTFEDGDDARGKGDIMVAKFRNGEPGICRLAYIAEHTRWDDLSIRDNPPTYYQEW